MKIAIIFLSVCLLSLNSCSQKGENPVTRDQEKQDSLLTKQEPVPEKITPNKIEIEKDFLYDQYTLDDSYPYKDTTRVFQWDKIREKLALLSNIQQVSSTLGILQNRNNKNGEAPLARDVKRNAYKRLQDPFGVERYQSIPLYLPEDLSMPERYERDGALVKLIEDGEDTAKVETVYFEGQWIVPKKYIKPIDTKTFEKVIFVDRTNENIATLERVDSKWLVRSMNPATTGLHNPPYMEETPLGIFVVQEKKAKMIYLVDGTQKTGGFAPYASRFCNGGYIHGIPVNAPSSKLIEYSPTLGTTPRSHMCVRNATSHAKFVYDWAPVNEALVIVLE